jgi:hypothetical protein
MNKLRFGAAGLIVAGVAGAAAVATAATSWPSVKVTPTVTPNRAGTRAHPQPVKLKTVFHWQTLGSANQPIVIHFKVKFPKGSLYNGAHTKTCSLSKLNRGGPSACPKASIQGSGTGTAYADQTQTHPRITVVNGGATKVYFYTVLNNPARVQEAVIGHIARASGKWAYVLNVTIPTNLRIVAGVPIELTYLSVTAGKGHWLETIGCSHHKWPFSVTTTYLNPNTQAQGSSSYSSSVKCRT